MTKVMKLSTSASSAFWSRQTRTCALLPAIERFFLLSLEHDEELSKESEDMQRRASKRGRRDGLTKMCTSGLGQSP